jgi:hypothetical protein
VIEPKDGWPPEVALEMIKLERDQVRWRALTHIVMSICGSATVTLLIYFAKVFSQS